MIHEGMMNLFSQPGETDGYGAVDHVRAVEHHLGRVVDAALVHGRPLPARLVESYAAQDSHPVRVERRALRSMGVMVVEADLLEPGGAARVARALLELLR